ncbi:G-type lectin s-receptor-like serinethreonine-protein kinase [Heracleum sosnowskyi]|uniref:G-type lectin s-receptor-like serinethreonine-protein kinase n=1 Tax=Heracleum sosnowskyi TaxID=360622 RepID=A0AAD8M662_9APIA|nr:G-type lectin s-receptor-like serinethreonine-protein kinase [Heracleum sosnowskyi]
MSSTQNLKDGDTIVSSGGIFELGFFKPGESKNRYLGIWYKTVYVQTVVWVANREVGVNDTTSVLKLTSSGTLNLYNNTNGVIIWSSDSKRLGVNPVLQLFDNGNLVVREKNDNDPIGPGSLASTYHGWAAVAVAVLVVENLIAALLQPAFNAQHFSSFQCYLT